MIRKDLTSLKVYAIDVDEADEVNQNKRHFVNHQFDFHSNILVLIFKKILVSNNSLMMPWVQWGCRMGELEYGYTWQTPLLLCNHKASLIGFYDNL